MAENSDCVCHTDAPLRGLLHIAILHLIKDKSAHGGEIYQTLKEKFNIDAPRGIIYALLRRMEGDNLIVSNWNIQETGPARRIYHITDDGLEYLKGFLERLRRASQMIHILLEEKS
ncbi:PadR family transcriptional regulator [Chloroflexota bacterium]